jgi:hypothetical protein
MKQINIIFLATVGLMLFSAPTGWSKSLEKLKIEYSITEMNRMCDRCSGRGTVVKKDLERVEFGEDNDSAPESCPKCSGSKFIKAEGTGGVDYYTKTVVVTAFSPDAKRQKLFDTKKYRKKFLNKYFFVDYVLVVTKDSKQADIDKLPKALQKLHYLQLQFVSVKKAQIDREKGETKFELIYMPKEKTANSTAANNSKQKSNDDLEDDFDEDSDNDGLVKTAAAIFEEDEGEPQRIYLSFRSETTKKKVLAATEEEIIATKKKYHLLYD